MIYLDDPVLGRLDLDCEAGFVVASLEVGWPQTRDVLRNRALADGVQDDTTYLGQRAVTLAVRVDSSVMPTQAVLDMLTPFLSPRRRPTLVYTVQDPSVFRCGLQDDPRYVRSLELRGVEMPLVIDAPRYTTVVCQWVSTGSYALATEETCAVSNTTGTAEFGREYDLTFDRDYPASPVFGITYFNVNGNAPAEWVGTLTAEIEDPEILVNSTTIEFTGLTLTSGQTVIIDTLNRTILRNGDPADSVFGLSNFADWTWDDLRLTAGQNQIRLQGSNVVGNPAFTICWRDSWF